MSSFKSEAQRCDKFLQCGFTTSPDVVIATVNSRKDLAIGVSDEVSIILEVKVAASHGEIEVQRR